MSNHLCKKEMKAFKDYTIEDFANPELFTYTSMKDHHRDTKRPLHCGLCRVVKTDDSNSRIPVPRTIHRIGELTEEILAVPTVTRKR